jgi:hypothetical protein
MSTPTWTHDLKEKAGDVAEKVGEAATDAAGRVAGLASTAAHAAAPLADKVSDTLAVTAGKVSESLGGRADDLTGRARKAAKRAAKSAREQAKAVEAFAGVKAGEVIQQAKQTSARGAALLASKRAAAAAKAAKSAAKAAADAEKAAGRKNRGHRIRRFFVFALLAGAAAAAYRALKSPAQTQSPTTSGAPTYPARTTSNGNTSKGTPSAARAGEESITGTDAKDGVAQAEKTAAVAQADDTDNQTAAAVGDGDQPAVHPADPGKHAADGDSPDHPSDMAGPAAGDIGADNPPVGAEGSKPEGSKPEGSPTKGNK